MTRCFQFFITTLFIVSLSMCQAMENSRKDIQEINSGRRKLTSIAFLQDNILALGGDFGSFFNVTENVEIKKFYNQRIQSIVTNKNKTKIAVAINNYHELSVWDAKERKKVESLFTHDKVRASAFSPLNNDIFTADDLVLYDNNGNSFMLPVHGHNKHICIAHHPIEKKIAYFSADNILSFINTDVPFVLSTTKAIKNIIGSIYKFLYNSGGTTLALFSINENGSKFCMCLYQIESHNSYPLESCYHGMALHPNGVIAALLKRDQCIDYMNIKTYQRVFQTNSLCHIPSSGIWDAEYPLDFSPDGKKLVVALPSNRCFILDVPFEAVYQSDTKKRLQELFYAFMYGKNRLPKEMVQHLMDYLIDVSTM